MKSLATTQAAGRWSNSISERIKVGELGGKEAARRKRRRDEGRR